MFDVHLRRLLDMGVKGNGLVDRLAGKACNYHKCLSSRKIRSVEEHETCGHKVRDITPSIAWRREAWDVEALDDLYRKDERGPS